MSTDGLCHKEHYLHTSPHKQLGPECEVGNQDEREREIRDAIGHDGGLSNSNARLLLSLLDAERKRVRELERALNKLYQSYISGEVMTDALIEAESLLPKGQQISDTKQPVPEAGSREWFKENKRWRQTVTAEEILANLKAKSFVVSYYGPEERKALQIPVTEHNESAATVMLEDAEGAIREALEEACRRQCRWCRNGFPMAAGQRYHWICESPQMCEAAAIREMLEGR